MRCDYAGMCMEYETLVGVKGEWTDRENRERFGEARIVREGGDVTSVACGRRVGLAEKVSDKLAGEGIGVDLLDLRTTSPLDEEAILDRSEEHTSELQSLMRI